MKGKDGYGTIYCRTCHCNHIYGWNDVWFVFCQPEVNCSCGVSLEQLEKKQDIHNGVIDRVYKLEKGVALNKEDIKVANHRIEDLERKE